MHRNILLVIALLVVMAVPAWAQQDYRVEISAFGGYTFSEGVPVSPAEVDGEIFDQITPVSGGSYGMNASFFFSEQSSFGFQFAQQLSALEGKGRTKREFVDMKVNIYHGIFTYNLGYGDDPLRPFIFGGLGATQYSPGDFEGQPVAGETRFSTTWGGGVKYYASDNVGFNFTARWVPTYINSSPGGIWCNPWWPGGCYQLTNSNYSNQFELAAASISGSRRGLVGLS